MLLSVARDGVFQPVVRRLIYPSPQIIVIVFYHSFNNCRFITSDFLHFSFLSRDWLLYVVHYCMSTSFPFAAFNCVTGLALRKTTREFWGRSLHSKEMGRRSRVIKSRSLEAKRV